VFAGRITRHLNNVMTLAQVREFFGLMFQLLLVIIRWITPVTSEIQTAPLLS
jgi:hypothetical protein